MVRLSFLTIFLAAAASAMWQPQIIKCSMTPAGIAELFTSAGSFHYSIPRVLVFDSDGNAVAAFIAYAPNTAANIQAAVRKRGRAGGYKLSTLTATLTAEDGKPFDGESLKGTPVIAELGADWCVPCRKLREDMKHVAGATILEIDADMQKHQREVEDALKRRPRT